MAYGRWGDDRIQRSKKVDVFQVLRKSPKIRCIDLEAVACGRCGCVRSGPSMEWATQLCALRWLDIRIPTFGWHMVQNLHSPVQERHRSHTTSDAAFLNGPVWSVRLNCYRASGPSHVVRVEQSIKGGGSVANW